MTDTCLLPKKLNTQCPCKTAVSALYQSLYEVALLFLVEPTKTKHHKTTYFKTLKPASKMLVQEH